MAVNIGTIAKATAFVSWVEAVTGSRPEIARRAVELADGSIHEYIEVVFNDQQKSALIAYLDNSVGGMFDTQRPPTDLQLNLGEVIIPWSSRYLIPAFLAAAGIGFIGGRFLRR